MNISYFNTKLQALEFATRYGVDVLEVYRAGFQWAVAVRK